MQTKVALRNVAVPTAHFFFVPIVFAITTALLQSDKSAQSCAIRFHTDQLQADPVSNRRSVVIKRRFLVHVVDQSLLVTIVEQIAERHAATRMWLGQNQTRIGGGVGEGAVVAVFTGA